MNNAMTSGTGASRARDQRSDCELIAAILSGETHLYEMLIQPYQQRVYRAALFHLKDEEDARDVVQESFLKAFLKLNTFQSRSQFSTWLTSITINEARNRIRQRSSFQMISVGRHSNSEGMEFVASVPDTRETPSQFLERQELSCLLKQAVEGLSYNYRNVFELRIMQELSTCETAKRLKITSTSVKTRLHRARSLLQVSLRSNLGEERRSVPPLHAEPSVVHLST